MTRTLLETIYYKFNILSDKDFKEWMLNSYDELLFVETYDKIQYHEHRLKNTQQEILLRLHGNHDKNFEGISNRVRNILRSKDIYTLDDLTSYTRFKLFGFRGMGKKGILELDKLLFNNNLKYK